MMHVHAQTPVYRWINNTNGLPTNAIYYLHQDKRGFIWIAHDRGLTRYDGKKFKHFNNVSQRGRSLTNIMETGDSVIWCQDFAGNFFYVQNDSLMLEQRIVSNGLYAPACIFNERYLVHPNTKYIYIILIQNRIGRLTVKALERTCFMPLMELISVMLLVPKR